MAKNITKEQLQAQVQPRTDPQTYEGVFIGELQGNADTATSLAQSFTVTAGGDATGSFTTAGTNTTFNLNIHHATEAETAKHADVAASAATASTATYASSADTAASAARATTADTATLADHATTADNANTAAQADYATNAGTAEHAVNADSALLADKAKSADIAEVARSVENPDAPVQEAKHAEKADLAVMAQYDCEGFSFKDRYAKKDEVVLKRDAFTKQEADALYANYGELLQTATVTGQAFGRGYRDGTNLVIQIDSLLTGEAASFYNALEFLGSDKLPDQPDNAKIYITNDGQLWLYNHSTLTWSAVKSTISDNIRQEITEALNKLNNVVDLTSDQTIEGKKTFVSIPQIPISSLRDDPDRNAASLHNIRDVQKTFSMSLSELSTEIRTKLDQVNARLDAQQTGDLLFAYKDYSQPANQTDMIVGTTYIALLEEDKTFIQLDPHTNEPVDKEQVPYYWRYFRKDSKGHVTWQDYKINSATFTEYARLDGADFTGNVTVQNKADPLLLNGLDVLNVHDIRIILDDTVNKALENADLDRYMEVAGGTFTGNVYVPDYADPVNAPENIVLNKQGVISLIQDNSFTIHRLESAPVEETGLSAQILYAAPSKNANFGGEVSEINLYEGQTIDLSKVSNGELAAFVGSNLLAN